MKRILILMALVALIASACSGGGGEETTTTLTDGSTTTVAGQVTTPTSTAVPTTTVPATSTTTTTATAADPATVWPLTGEPGFVAGTPVTMVKIDNTSRGRPQEGLDKADLVFEIIVEGGIPRLLAAFQSEVPDVIGPVRSVRETDVKLIEPFAAYFANSGGQGFIRELLDAISRDISHPNLGNKAYFRAPDRPSVYDLMLEPYDAFERRVPLVRENTVRLNYGPALPGDDGATEVTLEMSRAHRSVWRWSAEDGAYLRFNGTAEHRAASGEQIAANNVIALEVEQILLNRTDAAGSRVPDYKLVDSGPMVLFRDGQAYEGTWERIAFKLWFSFRDANNVELPLATGTTWIELVPAGEPISWS